VEQVWSQKEEENALNQRRERVAAAQAEELHPSRRWPHKFFILVAVVTALAAFAMGLGQILGIAFQSVGPIQYVLRFYVVLLSLLVILNELELTSITRESRILRYWITRGVFYAFIGLLGLEENDTSSSTNANDFRIGILYTKAVAWIMVGLGGLYFVMGVCCLQLLEHRLRTNYEERKERARILRDSASNTQNAV